MAHYTFEAVANLSAVLMLLFKFSLAQTEITKQIFVCWEINIVSVFYLGSFYKVEFLIERFRYWIIFIYMNPQDFQQLQAENYHLKQ